MYDEKSDGTPALTSKDKIGRYLISIILLVVFAGVLVTLIESFQISISSIGALNIPFSSFFGEAGLIVLILIVAIILVFVYNLLPSPNKR